MNKNFLQKLLVGVVFALALGGVFYLFYFAQYRAPEIHKKRTERETIKAKREALLTHKTQRTQKAKKTSDNSEDWKIVLKELNEMLAEPEVSEDDEALNVQKTVETKETAAPSADEPIKAIAWKKPSISPAEYQRLTEALEKVHELRNILNARGMELSDRRMALFDAANAGILTEEESMRELELIDKEDNEIGQQLSDLANKQVEIHRRRGTLVLRGTLVREYKAHGFLSDAIQRRGE
jgi:predicted secreted protein